MGQWSTVNAQLAWVLAPVCEASNCRETFDVGSPQIVKCAGHNLSSICIPLLFRCSPLLVFLRAQTSVLTIEFYIYPFCGIQDVSKQIFPITMGQWTLQDVQTEDLQIAYPSPVVWSVIMEPLHGLGQSTSAMMAFFWWGVTPGSAKMTVTGMGAYPSVSQRNQVLYLHQFRMSNHTTTISICWLISMLVWV